MLVDLFLIVIPFLWLVVASIIDIQTREVPDWLSYSLILIGLATRATYALLSNTRSFFFAGLLALAIAFLVGSFMYYTKQWGGGDSKLIMGIAVMYATTPTILAGKTHMHFLLAYAINMILVAAVCGTGYAFILGIRNKTNVQKELAKKEYRYLRYLWTPFIILGILTLLFIHDSWFRSVLLLSILSLALLSYLLTLTKIIETTCMHKHKPLRALREGDWIVHDIYAKGKLIVHSKTIGLEKKDLAALHNAKIHTVLIKEGMPFVPVFCIALIITLAFGPLLLTPETLATLKDAVFAVW